MNKIPTLFLRDDKFRVIDSVTLGCGWVVDGEGVATRKYDGTCCMVRNGQLFKRFELKDGKEKPLGFEATGPWVNGKQPGWVPVGHGPDDKWHREAWDESLPDGTYELCGPKAQGNPEGFPVHMLIPHGVTKYFDAPRTFEELKQYLAERNIEGIVWHHPDGRMAKIKKRDYGLRR